MLSEKPRGGLSETRKMTKSTMEKKRRARINNSLTELKAILSGMISNKGERFDKMEKADILELTVKCVRQLQKQTKTGECVRSPTSPVDEDYRSGMHTCMSEVIKFISSGNFSEADPEVKTKLLNHLANKLNNGTTQQGSTDHSIPYSYKKVNTPENSPAMSNMTNTDSDSISNAEVSNDSNNNLQSINEHNTTLSVNFHEQKSSSPVPPIPSPQFTSYKPIQPVQETIQQPTSVPTVPLTILVPANICSAALGTTCVIPFNLPNASPQLGQGSILQTVSQTPQTSFTINSNPSISLLQTPNFVQNTQLPSKVNEFSELSPQNRLYTFTPTVLSNFSRTQTQNSKPATAPFTKSLHSQDESESSTILKSTQPVDAAKDQTSNFPKISQPNELHLPQVTGLPRMTRKDVTGDIENRAHNIMFKNSLRDSSITISNKRNQEKRYQDKRKVEHKLINDTDYSVHIEQRDFDGKNISTEQPENRSFVYNRIPGNGCDNVSDMWRPWKTAI